VDARDTIGTGDASAGAVTAVRTMWIRERDRASFEAHMATLVREALAQPGHLGATMVRPLCADDAYRFLYRFRDAESMDAWHRSALRRRLMAPIEPLLQREDLRTERDFVAWFLPAASPDISPWRSTLVSWAAIYPCVVGCSALLTWLGIAWPMPMQALLVTAIVVPLVALVIGPSLARLLGDWLRPGKPTPEETRRNA
jgi:uncharacterized protein